MTKSGSKNEKKKKKMRASERMILAYTMKQRDNLVPEGLNSIFHAMYSDNIDYLQIGKFMSYIFNKIICVLSCKYFFKFFVISFLETYQSSLN